METTIYRFNTHWNKNFKNENTIIRKKYLNKIIDNIENKEIIFLTGIRRIGKTTLMKQTINFLIENKKVNPIKILFLSLDDFIFKNKTLFDIIEEYKKINEIGFDEFFYLFVDEITYLEDFHQQLKNLYDTWNIKIIVSSSNANILNDKKAYLTGRTLTIEIYPLSYEEFLIFRNLNLEKYDTTLNEKYFEKYMEIGGIPEYVLKENSQYLLEVLNSIIQKDIIYNYNIKNEKTIKELFSLLMERIGKPTSYNKLSNILKIKPETIKKYIGYFEKTYLLFSIDRFSKSKNENITSPKKFYVIDTGLKNLISNFEKGNCFENLVFIELYKNRKILDNINYFLEDGIEIDFRTKNKLVESKYKNAKLTEKQNNLFEKTKVKEKYIISNYKEFDKLKN
jgi:predicted AAA+ superfamily ATPase